MISASRNMQFVAWLQDLVGTVTQEKPCDLGWSQYSTRLDSTRASREVEVSPNVTAVGAMS